MKLTLEKRDLFGVLPFHETVPSFAVVNKCGHKWTRRGFTATVLTTVEGGGGWNSPLFSKREVGSRPWKGIPELVGVSVWTSSGGYPFVSEWRRYFRGGGSFLSYIPDFLGGLYL